MVLDKGGPIIKITLYLTPRHPAVSGYLWRKWQGQVTELGRNIRLTLFFTVCLTWHILYLYGTEHYASLDKERRTGGRCNDTAGCQENNDTELNCFELNWFWTSGKPLGWDDDAPELRISTFDFFYSVNILVCIMHLVFIIR